MKMKESKKINKYLYLVRELKRPLNMKVRVISIFVDISQGLTKERGNQRTKRNLTIKITVEISLNIEESPEDRRRLAVTQTSLKDLQGAK